MKVLKDWSCSESIVWPCFPASRSFLFLCPPAECSVMTVYYLYSMFISHPRLFCFSANWSPAASSTPVVFNWHIDSAVWKLDHLQKTSDWRGGKMPQSYKTPSRPQCGFVARCPPGRAQTLWQMIHYMFEQHELWMVEKMNTFPTLCWESSESPCFPPSYVISAELRSECLSSAQKPKFNCLVTHVYSGQKEQQRECVQCVLREGCVRTPRLLQHTVQTLR